MTASYPSAYRQHLPLLTALALYLALALFGAWQIWQALGEPIYAIDDVHIHMAMARNLVQHGVYGVTPWETAHASSSPLWVLILAAGFALVGPWYLLPGVLTLISCITVIVIADRCLRVSGDNNFRALASRGFVLCLIVAGASLPPLTWQAMEHPLHAALLLPAAWLGARSIAGLPARRSSDAILVLLCLALPILRYESLWLTALLSAGLLWRRRYWLAAALVIASAASVCAVGFWAISKGLTFLPAPILTKSVGPMLFSDNSILRLAVKFVWHPLWRLGQQPLLAILFVSGVVYLATMLWRKRLTVLDRPAIVLVALFIGGTWLHASFATFGWGNRYEAYLIVLGLVALGGVAIELARTLDAAQASHRLAGLLVGLAAALAIYTALGRAYQTYRNAQAASAEVLERDFYIARFLAGAYARESVMAMNIGAVVWAGEPRLLDPVALGTPEVLRLIFSGRYDLQALDAMAREREVRVFAVFDEWFGQWFGTNPPWIKVALIDAQPHRRKLTLSLYAPDEAEGKILAERLRKIVPAGKYTATIKVLPPFDAP